MDHRQLHERREADRRAGVVGEDQVGRPDRAQLAERQPVGDRGRLVLANPVVQDAAGAVLGREGAGPVERQPAGGRARQVRRAADQPRHPRGDRVQHLVRRLAGRDPARIGVEARYLGVPALRQLAALHLVDLRGEPRVARRDALLPLVSQLAAPSADPVGEMLVHAVGDQELGVLGPVVGALRLAHLVLAERLPVDLGGVLLVRRAVADVAVDDDQRRPPLLAPEDLEGPGQQLQVVGVAHPGDVPAVADEAGRDVVAVGELGAAVDRDVVVVVDPAEVVQALVAGDRAGLSGDPLHQVAVAADRVDVEVEQLRAEVRAEPLAADRHPHGRRDALAEWAGGRLHARGQVVLGMAGRLGAELAERLDVVQADRRLPERLVVGVDRLRPGQVQQRVEQHRGVPGREHEAVAVGPDRIRRVEAQEALPEDVGDRGHGHRRSRVAGVGLLNRVDRQGPDRVDAERVQVGRLGLSDRRHLSGRC